MRLHRQQRWGGQGSARWRRKLAAIVLAAACLGVIVKPSPAAAKDTAVIGMVLEPPTLDPTASAAAAVAEVGYANVYEGLTRIDEKGAVRPGLASSWTMSGDGLAYSFDLRPDATFQDGAPCTSADVQAALDRARAPGSTNPQKGLFAAINAVATPTPQRVDLKLSRPDGLLLFRLGQAAAAIVGGNDTATRPLGTGPFRVGRWVKGDRVELERWDGYRGPDRVRLREVTFRFIADPAAAVAALMAGDVDAFPNMPAPEALAQFKNDPRFTVEVGTTEGETIMGLNLREKPFSDLRVRQALAHAVDRRAIVDGAMFGVGTPIGSHFSPQNPAYVDLTGVYPHDPARAKALLREAGYPDGFETTLTLPPPTYARRGGEIIQAELASVGIKVELVPVEWAQWLSQVFKGHRFDMTIVSHVEPLDLEIYARGRENYYFGFDDPTFDGIMKRLEVTLDPSDRTRLYGEAQRRLTLTEPAIFLFELAEAGVRAVGLKGLWVDRPIAANDMTEAYWQE